MEKIKLYIPILILALTFVLSSCEEVIEIDLNSADPVLVAEGYMELDSLCQLKLTYTTDYFQEEAPVPLNDAVVILKDQNGSEELLMHMGAGIYWGQSIRGEEYAEYTISIETEEQVHSGSSRLMPVPVFDSVLLEEFPFGSSHPGQDFPKMLRIYFRNNPGLEDRFMLKLKLNGKPLDTNFSLASDQYSTSAETVVYSTSMYPTEDGDTLSMQVFAIDEDTYFYYTQLNEAIGGGMAMSSTPYNPASNLGEDIMGYFMARSMLDTTLIVK